jgi:hypothetical protein
VLTALTDRVHEDMYGGDVPDPERDIHTGSVMLTLGATMGLDSVSVPGMTLLVASSLELGTFYCLCVCVCMYVCVCGKDFTRSCMLGARCLNALVYVFEHLYG